VDRAPAGQRMAAGDADRGNQRDRTDTGGNGSSTRRQPRRRPAPARADWLSAHRPLSVVGKDAAP
jgi:hypothetical protein